MIANEGSMLRLGITRRQAEAAATKSLIHTPRISGMRTAGSVDMDASSMKTTGKSRAFKVWLAEVMHVVQT